MPINDLIQRNDATQIAPIKKTIRPIPLTERQKFNMKAFGQLWDPILKTQSLGQGVKMSKRQIEQSQAKLQQEGQRQKDERNMANLREHSEAIPYLIPGIGQAMWAGKAIDMATKSASKGKYESWGDMVDKNVGGSHSTIDKLAADITNPGYYAGSIAKIANSLANKQNIVKELSAAQVKDIGANTDYKFVSDYKLDNSFMNKYYRAAKKDERLRQNRLFDRIIDEHIKSKITDENLLKAKKWDEEYGSKIYNNLSDLKKSYEYQDIRTQNKSPYPFDVNVFTKQEKGHNFKIAGYAGYKEISPEERLKRNFTIKNGSVEYMENPRIYISDRTLGIRKSEIGDRKLTDRVIGHELGHITEGGFEWPESMNNRFLEIMKDQSSEIEKNIKNGILNKKSIKAVESKTKLIEYYNTPTEISQHGVTNMRQELVDKGLIGNDGTFTKEHIDELFRIQENKGKMNYVGRDFFKYVDKTKSDKIAKLINEYPKVIIPAVGLYGVNKSKNNVQQSR